MCLHWMPISGRAEAADAADAGTEKLKQMRQSRGRYTVYNFPIPRSPTLSPASNTTPARH